MKKNFFVLFAFSFILSCGKEKEGKEEIAPAVDSFEISSQDIYDIYYEEHKEISIFSEIDFLIPDIKPVDYVKDYGKDNYIEKSKVGAPCKKNDDCGGNGVCLLNLPNGYCSIPNCTANSCPSESACFEFEGQGTFCIKTCNTDADCRLEEGYFCDQDKTCWYKGSQGEGNVGEKCSNDNDCKGNNALCYPEIYKNEPTGFTDGYCIIWSCTANSCPSGSGCFKVTDQGETACLKTCNNDNDCRKDEGYFCNKGICWPGCKTDTNCPPNYICGKIDGFCINKKMLCSPQNPQGYCEGEGELTCENGQCKTFEFKCEDKTYEPNETMQQAAKINEELVISNLQLCKNDIDFYNQSVSKGYIGTLGITFKNKYGDLDLVAYDVFGNFLGSRLWIENYGDNLREYETDEEFLSGLALSGNKNYFYKVRGYKGAVNNYKLENILVSYKDGFNCTDYYDFADCKGLKEGKTNLYQFPFPDPDDGYVGNLYMFDSYSNYRWARRELIMLVRYAINAVQKKFPKTKPLGLVDICQKDGITPGYDVGNPRHPPSTHDQGGNIDVAYYSTTADNHAKVICDKYGGSNDGYYCTSVANHIVDLPRVVYFLSKFAESPRFRVAGVDKLIAPLLLNEAKKQKNQGWMTNSVYNTLVQKLAYGDGWPFHHHHIHISLQWWSSTGAMMVQMPVGCGFRMPGDGPLPPKKNKNLNFML